MKTLQTILISSLFLLFVTSASAQVKYKSVAGNFSVSLPGTPEESSQDVETEVGTIKMYSFMYQPASGTPIFMIAYCDYSEEAIKASNAETLLTNAMDGFLKSLEIPKELSKMVKLDKKYDGIYFQGKSSQYSTKNYNYLVGPRLYQVAVLSLGDYISKSEYDKFFDSFKLLDK
ncbi:MAG: hypothetical protein V2A54_05745 [Bacteroidota bacterium]